MKHALVIGTVLNPDGSPADRASVRVKTVTVYKNPPTYPGRKPTYSIATGDHSSSTNREGQFEMEAPAGSFVLASAYSTSQSRTLVSSYPIVHRVDSKDDPISRWSVLYYHQGGSGKHTAASIIQLQEGILVCGTAMFEDGTPAVGRTISGVRPIWSDDPAFSDPSCCPPTDRKKKDSNIQNAFDNNFVLEFQTRVQADGTYELYLPPGKFHVKEFNDSDGIRAVFVTIKENDEKEHRIDFLKIPAPLRGKFVKEDGSDPGRLNIHHGSKIKSMFTSIDSGGEFLYERSEGSYLVALTNDASLGIIHQIPDNRLSEYHTIVLKPTATVKFELRDSSGQPIVGKEIAVSILTKTSSNSRNMTNTLIQPVITDDKGVAEFKFPSGTGSYQFSWEGGKDYERELTLQPGETVVIVR